MERIKNTLFFLIFIVVHSLAADNNPASLKSANDTYQAGDFETAIKQYETLLEGSQQSADLHYNLGNAYFRSNKLGKAALHFEKAALLKPRDKDILHNLKVLKNNLPDQFEVIPAFFVTRWWNEIQKITSPTGWGILGLLILWAGIAGIILWLRGGDRETRKKGFFIGVILIILSILPFTLGFSACKKLENSKRAVIMKTETNLRSAPDEESESILELHEGTSLLMLDEIGEWKKIRLSNGEEGWLETKVLEKI